MASQVKVDPKVAHLLEITDDFAKVYAALRLIGHTHTRDQTEGCKRKLFDSKIRDQIQRHETRATNEKPRNIQIVLPWAKETHEQAIVLLDDGRKGVVVSQLTESVLLVIMMNDQGELTDEVIVWGVGPEPGRHIKLPEGEDDEVPQGKERLFGGRSEAHNVTVVEINGKLMLLITIQVSNLVILVKAEDLFSNEEEIIPEYVIAMPDKWHPADADEKQVVEPKTLGSPHVARYHEAGFLVVGLKGRSATRPGKQIRDNDCGCCDWKWHAASYSDVFGSEGTEKLPSGETWAVWTGRIDDVAAVAETSSTFQCEASPPMLDFDRHGYAFVALDATDAFLQMKLEPSSLSATSTWSHFTVKVRFPRPALDNLENGASRKFTGPGMVAGPCKNYVWCTLLGYNAAFMRIDSQKKEFRFYHSHELGSSGSTAKDLRFIHLAPDATRKCLFFLSSSLLEDEARDAIVAVQFDDEWDQIRKIAVHPLEGPCKAHRIQLCEGSKIGQGVSDSILVTEFTKHAVFQLFLDHEGETGEEVKGLHFESVQKQSSDTQCIHLGEQWKQITIEYNYASASSVAAAQAPSQDPLNEASTVLQQVEYVDGAQKNNSCMEEPNCSEFDHLQNSPGRDKKKFEVDTMEPMILDHRFDHKGKLPDGFLPEDFSREVFLRVLDLVDRCNQSTIFVLGLPRRLEPALGKHKSPELNRKWSSRNVTVFDRLFNDDLADFYKGGAVLIDCGGGKIHEVTVELLLAPVRITQMPERPVVVICKNLDSREPSMATEAANRVANKNGEHEDVLEGWVSIFSSGCSHKEPQFYRYKHGEQSLQERIDQEDCRRLSNRVSKREPKEMRECPTIDLCQESKSTQSPQLPNDAVTPSTGASDNDFTSPYSDPSPTRRLPPGVSCDESPPPRTPNRRQLGQHPSTPCSIMSARSPDLSRHFFENSDDEPPDPSRNFYDSSDYEPPPPIVAVPHLREKGLRTS